MATKPIFDDITPWPTPAPNPRAVLGGNQPPLEERIPLEFREALLADRPDFLQKLDDLLGAGDPNSEAYKPGSVQRARCTDEETLKKCSSLVASLKAAVKHVDGVHKVQKQPFLDGGRLVDGQRNVLLQRINAGVDHVEVLQREFANEQRRIERERLQREADERARQQAELDRLAALARENNIEVEIPAFALPPEPAPMPVKSAPIRTDDGASVSMGVEYVSTVSDYTKAFRHVKHDAKVKEAIDAAIKRYVKSIKATDKTDLPGVVIVEQAKINNR